MTKTQTKNSAVIDTAKAVTIDVEAIPVTVTAGDYHLDNESVHIDLTLNPCGSPLIVLLGSKPTGNVRMPLVIWDCIMLLLTSLNN